MKSFISSSFQDYWSFAHNPGVISVSGTYSTKGRRHKVDYYWIRARVSRELGISLTLSSNAKMIQVLLPHFIISLLLSPRFVSHRVSSIVFASYCDSIISLNRRTDKGIPADDPRFYLAKSRTEHNRRQIRSSAERWLRARCTKTPCVMQCFIRHGNYERYLSFPYNNTVLAQTISRVCVIIGAQLVTTKFDKTCHTHAGCLNNASRAFPDFASSCIPPLREYLPSRLSTEKKCLIGRSLYPPRVANSIRSVKCPSFCRWNLARRDFHHHSVVSRCDSFHVVQDAIAIAIAHSEDANVEGKHPRVCRAAFSQCKGRVQLKHDSGEIRYLFWARLRRPFRSLQSISPDACF